MPEKDLEKYIGVVYDMEKSVYNQEKLIEKLKNEIDRLGITKIAKDAYLSNHITIFSIISIIIGFIVGCVVLAIIMINTDQTDKWFIIIFFSIVSIGMVRVGIKNLCNIAKAKRKYIVEIKYITRELKQKAILQTQIIALQEKLNESKKTLDYVYSVNIIHPKYRGLVPVSSIYEYLTTGVCDRLGGVDGAYNKYDIETRLDKIITRLDVIVASLEQIKSNQYMLYSAMKDVQNSNQKLYDSIENMSNTLNYSMDRIQELQKQNAKQINAALNNSEVIAYNSAITRKELEYRNYVDRIFRNSY